MKYIEYSTCKDFSSMENVPAVTVPLRTGKKMKKRKELDALVAHTVSKRASGVSSHEQLLTDSCDEWSGVAAGPAARGRRRVAARRRLCTIITKACSLLLVFTCAIATTTVMWLFIDVRQQVTSLRTQLNQVVVAHQGVPDALHACHSLSRELHNNQSDMSNKLTEMSSLQRNLTINITRLQDALAAIQHQLNASPSLVNDPRLVNDLSRQVAEFGSKIQDLESTVTSLKEVETRQDGLLTNIGSNLTKLDTQVAGLQVDRGGVSEKQLADTKAGILASFNDLVTNVTKLNDTFSSKLKWTSDDQVRDHTTVESLQEMDQNITARLRTLEEIIQKREAATTTQSVTGSVNLNGVEELPTPGGTSSAALLSPYNAEKQDLPPPLLPDPPIRP